MRRASILVLLFAVMLAGSALRAQVVMDRVVARIENDIVTLSDVRELAAYQRLSGREPAPESELIQELIDQWIVANDAAAARFPAAPAAQVDAQFTALRNLVGTPLQFAARLRELDLSEQDVRRLIAKQIFLDLYLERRFRAVARIPQADVERYYHDEFVPQLQQRKLPVPPLDDVRESITDVLVERDITRRAQQWIEQTRASLDLEIFAEKRP